MLTKLKRGDRIVTNGGIMGTITKVVNDNELQVEIAEDVRIRVVRSMVSNVEAKPQPQSNESGSSAVEQEDKDVKKVEGRPHQERRSPYRKRPVQHRRPLNNKETEK